MFLHIHYLNFLAREIINFFLKFELKPKFGYNLNSIAPFEMTFLVY